MERYCNAPPATSSSTSSATSEDAATDAAKEAKPEDTGKDILGEEGHHAKISAETGVAEDHEHPKL